MWTVEFYSTCAVTLLLGTLLSWTDRNTVAEELPYYEVCWTETIKHKCGTTLLLDLNIGILDNHHFPIKESHFPHGKVALTVLFKAKCLVTNYLRGIFLALKNIK
jgi:hypothetical protein